MKNSQLGPLMTKENGSEATQNTPTEPCCSRSWLKYALTALVTAIVVGGGMGWWAQERLESEGQKITEVNKQSANQVTDNTNETRGYVNIRYGNGMTFQYPWDWMIDPSQSEEIEVLDLLPVTQKSYSDDSYIHIAMIPARGSIGIGTSIEAYKAIYSPGGFTCADSELLKRLKEGSFYTTGSGYSIQSCEEKKIGGRPALLLAVNDIDGDQEYELHISFGYGGDFAGTRIETAIIGKRSNIKSVFDQIVSSLGFAGDYFATEEEYEESLNRPRI